MKYIFSIVASLSILLLLSWNTSVQANIAADADCDSPEQVMTYYNSDKLKSGFTVHEDVIKPNQVLSDLLMACNVDYPDIHELAVQSKEVFDIRTMKAGRPYTIICSAEDQKAQYMIYQHNTIDYVVFDLADSIQVHLGEKPVEKVRRTASGIINSSLYVALQEQNVNPILATDLAEIYAWSVDFFRIQKGDRFQVVYEEEFVGDKSVGISKVEAARFKHFDGDFFAFHFEAPDDSTDVGHFDEKGNSLQKQFLKAPLKYYRISSKFTRRRFHPVQKRWKAHLGTDYAAPTGTPIRATGDGIVIEATRKKFNGKYVKIRHNGVYNTQYLHMSKFAKGIKPGVKVQQGQVIGYVGSTGLATGPHVCYRFWKHGKQVNHFNEEFPPTHPVPEKYMDGYMTYKDELMQQLVAIPFPDGEVIPISEPTEEEVAEQEIAADN